MTQWQIRGAIAPPPCNLKEHGRISIVTIKNAPKHINSCPKCNFHTSHNMMKLIFRFSFIKRLNTVYCYAVD